MVFLDLNNKGMKGAAQAIKLKHFTSAGVFSA
jgi:hypothetical protein